MGVAGVMVRDSDVMVMVAFITMAGWVMDVGCTRVVVVGGPRI